MARVCQVAGGSGPGSLSSVWRRRTAFRVVERVLYLLRVAMPRAGRDVKDFDEVIQEQFAKARAVPFDTAEVIAGNKVVDWAEAESSQGANKEWFWCSALAAVAYFANFMEVEIHPGWRNKVISSSVYTTGRVCRERVAAVDAGGTHGTERVDSSVQQ